MRRRRNRVGKIGVRRTGDIECQSRLIQSATACALVLHPSCWYTRSRYVRTVCGESSSRALISLSDRPSATRPMICCCRGDSCRRPRSRTTSSRGSRALSSRLYRSGHPNNPPRRCRPSSRIRRTSEACGSSRRTERPTRAMSPSRSSSCGLETDRPRA